MKIYRRASLCGGYQKPKGHLDSQMFPECEGKPGDRDVVKKTREKRKRKKASVSKFANWSCKRCKFQWGKEFDTKKPIHCPNCGNRDEFVWNIRTSATNQTTEDKSCFICNLKKECV